MKKVIKIRVEKMWGYEDWIYSPLKLHNTKLEDGTLVTKGPLIKIIQANDKLSIQVHPNDEQAKFLDNELNGKAECWFVLDVNENPFIVGLNTYDINEIKKSIKDNQWDRILKTTMPKKYDFIDIPHGQVHGIPANSKVLEIQQPSDLTYRFYDYGRLYNGQERELHIDKALKCINNKGWELEPVSNSPRTYINDVCKIEFWEKPTIAISECIVVDIKNEQAYIYDNQEKIEIENKYIIINLRS